MSNYAFQVENYEQIYADYDQQELNICVARSMHHIASFMYHPHVTFDEGAEAKIAENNSNNVRSLIAANHFRMDDQFAFAAVFQKHKVFAPYIANTYIWAKSPYFKNRLLKSVITALGSIPVFRSADVQESQWRLASESNGRLMKVSLNKLSNNSNIFSFVGGTRKRGEKAKDIDQINESDVKGGIGRLAILASDQGYGISLVPMTVWYGLDQENFFTPNRHVGYPLNGPFTDRKEVIKQVHESMSNCLDRSIEASAQRATLPRSSRQKRLIIIDRTAKKIAAQLTNN
jgi:1-acyl-sn-glycerol-3-phosphate acyltransferase